MRFLQACFRGDTPISVNLKNLCIWRSKAPNIIFSLGIDSNRNNVGVWSVDWPFLGCMGRDIMSKSESDSREVRATFIKTIFFNGPLIPPNEVCLIQNPETPDLW